MTSAGRHRGAADRARLPVRDGAMVLRQHHVARPAQMTRPASTAHVVHCSGPRSTLYPMYRADSAWYTSHSSQFTQHHGSGSVGLVARGSIPGVRLVWQVVLQLARQGHAQRRLLPQEGAVARCAWRPEQRVHVRVAPHDRARLLRILLQLQHGRPLPAKPGADWAGPRTLPGGTGRGLQRPGRLRMRQPDLEGLWPGGPAAGWALRRVIFQLEWRAAPRPSNVALLRPHRPGPHAHALE